MGFDAPEVLLLLLAVPGLVVLYVRRWRHVRRVRGPFAASAHRGNPSTGVQFAAMLTLLVAGSASLIIAAAEPRIRREGQRKIYRKLDVVFLLDTSLSMQARDIAPSRLHRAAREIEAFIRHNEAFIGRLGLVGFSGSSVVLSYLTSDPANILFFLDHLTAERQTALDTDIGAAIGSGLSVVTKEQSLDATLDTRHLIFVLISDGEDHGPALKTAVPRVSEAGIRVYTVGIGTEMGDYIPIGEHEGRTVFLADEQGKQLMATFDEETLRWIAGATGGQYFRSRSGEDLQRNLGAILETEQVVVDVEKTAEDVPLHPWFLGAGFVALALRMSYRR